MGIARGWIATFRDRVGGDRPYTAHVANAQLGMSADALRDAGRGDLAIEVLALGEHVGENTFDGQGDLRRVAADVDWASWAAQARDSANVSSMWLTDCLSAPELDDVDGALAKAREAVSLLTDHGISVPASLASATGALEHLDAIKSADGDTIATITSNLVKAVDDLRIWPRP
jgi:hypothetical protein